MAEKSRQKVVHKYPLRLTNGAQSVELPYKAKILHFGMQDGKPMMWASHVVDEGTMKRTRYFRIIGTGHEICELATHKGTCFDDPYVWHLFEISPLPEFQ